MDKFSVLVASILFLTGYKAASQHTKMEVKVVGAMKDVMWKGQLDGKINLDTISFREHLYGLGPVEYLRGEILIIDGKSYKSTVLTDSTMKVEETYSVKAPFLGYANISQWKEEILPDSILTGKQLEKYLDLVTVSSARPFLFMLRGIVDHATIHIVNLPKGSQVYSPDDVQRAHRKFKIFNEESEVVGFFSTGHQGILTHHDTYLHMHLITADKRKMGHLEELSFKQGTGKLYLPVE
jgi:acetolactate decarboxylase